MQYKFVRSSEALGLARTALLASTMVSALSLTACGGGGGGSNGPATTSANAAQQGLYAGSTSSTVASSFRLLVLDGGSVWAIYGADANSGLIDASFINGTLGFSANNAVSSDDLRDFGSGPSEGGNLRGTFDGASLISGTVGYSDGSDTFAVSQTNSSIYDYNTPAQVSDLAGVWSVKLDTGETGSLNFSNTGVLGGTASSGCTFTGQATPRPSGKNVFNVTVTFTGAACYLPGRTASGIAITYAVTGGRQLVVAVNESSRQLGVTAFGTR